MPDRQAGTEVDDRKDGDPFQQQRTKHEYSDCKFRHGFTSAPPYESDSLVLDQPLGLGPDS